MKKYIACITLAFTVFSMNANAAALIAPLHIMAIAPATPMTAADVTALLNTIRGKANDAEKLAAFKDGLKDRSIKTDQLVALLGQFNEDAKLEAAIYAYQFTADFKKYYKIEDLFDEAESKHKLQDYIDRHRS